MNIHDAYGKKIIEEVANLLGITFRNSGNEIKVSYGNSEARIDCTVDQIAVEIESRTEKQIRGAIIDLYFHPYSKKLLVIIPANQGNSQKAKSQCEYILSKLQSNNLNSFKFKVILLNGNGDTSKKEKDKELVKKAIEYLLE